MLERDYQGKLMAKLRDLFPGCMILKNDPDYIQGIPDLLILFEDRWAALEVKASENSHTQANQEWYVKVMNEMSFAAFIWPENETEVLDALQRSFEFNGPTRISKR